MVGIALFLQNEPAKKKIGLLSFCHVVHKISVTYAVLGTKYNYQAKMNCLGNIILIFFAN